MKTKIQTLLIIALIEMVLISGCLNQTGRGTKTPVKEQPKNEKLEPGKDITVPNVGGTNIDVLLKDGTIVECKGGEFMKTLSYINNPAEWNKFTTQAQKFKKWQELYGTETKEIKYQFKYKPSDEIYEYLKIKNNIDYTWEIG